MLLMQYQIPLLTLVFVSFIIVINFRIRRNNSDQETVDKEFWDKERKANATPRQDTSNLCYINIPDDLFPHNIGSDTESNLKALINKPMLNLTGQTNTELKLQYGVPNFEAISECDNRFTEFVRLVPSYTNELIAAGHREDAIRILEFAVNNRADSRAIFNQLANIYAEDGESDKLNKLTEIANSLESLSKKVILSDLSSIKVL